MGRGRLSRCFLPQANHDGCVVCMPPQRGSLKRGLYSGSTCFRRFNDLSTRQRGIFPERPPAPAWRVAAGSQPEPADTPAYRLGPCLRARVRATVALTHGPMDFHRSARTRVGRRGRPRRPGVADLGSQAPRGRHHARQSARGPDPRECRARGRLTAQGSASWLARSVRTPSCWTLNAPRATSTTRLGRPSSIRPSRCVTPVSAPRRCSNANRT